jgi:hypothetical protein
MMNNKRFSIATLIIISTLILSCKKKPIVGPIPDNNCETKYQLLFGDAVSTNETTTAVYKNGQIKSINSSIGNIDYEYLPDKVNISAMGTPVYTIERSGNLATKFIDLKAKIEDRFTYDANRNLIKIETYQANVLLETKAMTYQNGNMNTITQTYPDDPTIVKITTFQYSSDLVGQVESESRHLLYGVTEPYLPLALIGTISKNVLTGSVYNWTADNFRSDITKTYTYTRNTNGATTKIVEDSHTLTIGNGIKTQDELFKRSILINSTCN